MADFLKDYSSIPNELFEAAKASVLSSRSGCTFDSTDCGQDCAKDSCSSDCKDNGCRTDATCTQDSGCAKDKPSTKPTGTGKLTLMDRTSTSVTLRLSSIANSDYYETAYRLASTNTATYGEIYSTTWTVSGLKPNTEYVFNYRGVNDAGTGPYMSSGLTVRTLSDFVGFDWTYAGIDEDGSLTLGPEKNPGADGVYVTADEWNELAGLVSEKTGEYITRVSAGTVISADIVNSMAEALGVSPVESEVTVVTGSFFNRLRSAYNSLE